MFVHIVPGSDVGGVATLARQVADATGAPVRTGSLAELDAASAARGPAEPWHLHFSDGLYGADPAEAARRVARWARGGPLTVTLHDVPQPWSSPARRRCYLDVACGVTAWAVNSHHEVALLLDAEREVGGSGGGGALRPGHVVPLPMVGTSAAPPRGPAPAAGASGAVSLGVLGWIYPDKGHREVIRAAGRLRAHELDVRITCLGAPVEGHLDLLEDLRRRADRAGVELSVSGYLAEEALAAAAREVDVPIAAHHHLSASGSINSWLAVGRRPLVADGRYARELAALRPGTLTLYDAHDPDGRGLDTAVRDALGRPASTWLTPGTPLGPGLAETAAAYRAWWASLSYAGPHPEKPVVPAW